MADTYQSLDLSGNGWTFGHVPAAPLWQSHDIESVQEWLPATVPGNVESDLLALGRIPDPFFGAQNERSRWVEGLDWWYRRSISLPLSAGQRAHLLLHGVDYYSAAYAGSSLLGTHEGMFSTQTYELTPLLNAHSGSLDLAVRLWGAHALPRRNLRPWQRLAEPLLQRIAHGVDMFPSRIRTLKCQMSFGWDFAPRLPSAGIWDDVEIVLSGPVFIANVWVRTRMQGQDAEVSVRLLLDSAIDGPARITVRISGANFKPDAQDYDFAVYLVRGRQERDLRFNLPAPYLWQPWDRGHANLYNVTVQIVPGGAMPSSCNASFGVRTIALPADKEHDWAFVINGEKDFVRGANWVPADALPGRLRAADYAELITMTKAANVNLLRVWGGGLREKRAFYDLCDREGLLVWQEFPLACPNLSSYPSDGHFLDLAGQETTSIVQDLRNHASVVLWCGGNEFGPARNKRIIERISSLVAEHDGTRPFRPASPSQRDRHNWRVWHHWAPLTEYLRERAPLVSEFGLQSAPDVASLRAFLPDGDLWPPGPSWSYHNGELAKLQHYAQTFIAPGARRQRSDTPRQISLQEFVEATQQAQARGVQMLVEHMRRRKGASDGVIVWQLNEPWPSICWSLVGYNRQPKMAYDMLRRVYAPLLVSVEYRIRHYTAGDVVPLAVWAINDSAHSPSPQPTPLQGEDAETNASTPEGARPTPSPQRGEGRGEGRSSTRCVLLLRLNNAEVYRAEIDVADDSSAVVGRLELPLAEPPWLLRSELWQGQALVAENDYDLGYYDERTMPPLHRLLTILGGWLLR